jgi:hypothetical protein
MSIADNRLDIESDGFPTVPLEERIYRLDKKEFDYHEPDIEITYDGRIPCPFITNTLRGSKHEM